LALTGREVNGAGMPGAIQSQAIAAGRLTVLVGKPPGTGAVAKVHSHPNAHISGLGLAQKELVAGLHHVAIQAARIRRKGEIGPLPGAGGTSGRAIDADAVFIAEGLDDALAPARRGKDVVGPVAW